MAKVIINHHMLIIIYQSLVFFGFVMIFFPNNPKGVTIYTKKQTKGIENSAIHVS